MIFKNIGLARIVNDADFSDLTASVQVGPAFWHQTIQDALVIPFDVDPSPDEVVLIRRRLVTDPSSEDEVGAMAVLVDGLRTANLLDVPFAQNENAQELLFRAVFMAVPQLRGMSSKFMQPMTTPEV